MAYAENSLTTEHWKLSRRLVLKDTGVLELQEGPLPSCARGEALIEVVSSAICRTDAKLCLSGHRDLVLPRVPGHEICGRWSGRDSMCVLWPGVSCGTCHYCQSGKENLCPEMRIMGFHRDGGFAEHVVVPADSLIEVPVGLPADIACLAEPLACGVNALEQGRIRPGESIAVVGAGPVGLLTALAARQRGAHVSIVDNNDERLGLSESFRGSCGIADCTGLACYDVVINACATVDGFAHSIELTRSAGRFVYFSGLPSEETITTRALNEIHYRQLVVAGAYGCTKKQMLEALDVLNTTQEWVRDLLAETVELKDISGVLPDILAGRRMKTIVCFR